MFSLAYNWGNHLTQGLFYNKGLNISCNLLDIVLKVGIRMVIWVCFFITVKFKSCKWNHCKSGAIYKLQGIYPLHVQGKCTYTHIHLFTKRHIRIFIFLASNVYLESWMSGNVVSVENIFSKHCTEALCFLWSWIEVV
jgi:hypothetical protein